MALRINAATDRITRTVNLPSRTSFTICAWVNRQATHDFYAALLGITDSVSGPNSSYEVNWNTNILGLQTYGGGSFPTFSSTPGIGTWFFVALTGDGTNVKAYAGTTGVLETITATLVTFTPACMWFGDNGWGESGDFRVAAIKVYDIALTLSQLENERRQFIPYYGLSLNIWSPATGIVVADEIKDYSGNGRNWTDTSIAYDSDAPPIPWKSGRRKIILIPTVKSAIMTGTGIGGITEADVVAGGKVITVTITDDTLIPA